MKLLAAMNFAQSVFYFEPRWLSFLFSSVSKITNRQQVVLFTVFYFQEVTWKTKESEHTHIPLEKRLESCKFNF